ncbi:tRNA 2'-phosphotransferase 1-like [Planoprotostelium fungivorum]|uniref:2'-phosphotransferase n=1 Tax=Planoprotostelium fungivorum TaxID=1890364 RepID=A0A2P6NIM6_9EUKA|nr:tRNA 2'-phosphotransferase 1-like [Planoprotostelium fungivorum]
MGRKFVLSVSGEKVWCCRICTTPLIDNNLMLSDKYTSSTGEAFLFTEAANVCHGRQRTEKLRSGIYLICDLHCVNCHQRLGWHYEESVSEEQKYKEGKCVLEKQQIALQAHRRKISMSRRGAKAPRIESRDVKLSKAVSYVLRHGAEKVGLKMDEGGFVKVEDLMAIPDMKKNKFTLEELQSVVANNEKKRFHMEERDGVSWIRANQGHSLKIESLATKKITKENVTEYPIVVHGTYKKFWPSIKREGLRKMGRNHVHFAKGLLGEESVISGFRSSSEVLIFLDLAQAVDDGIVFEESANGVVLSEGVNGIIAPKYFKKVLASATMEPFDTDYPEK